MNAADRRCFADTNLLLYTLDGSNLAKQAAALAWRDALWERRLGRLSWQVLNEFYANATGKMGAPPATARQMVESYAQWQAVEFTLTFLQRAWHWTDQAGVDYWDALILAAAERTGCRYLLSEDFPHERRYGPMQVIDPFRVPPDEFFAS